MRFLTLRLPWPPSVNTYWRHIVINGRPRTLISKAGRQYKTHVQLIASRYGPFVKPIAMWIHAYPPDRRKRDIDNILKAPLDSLEKAGVYKNDSQIVELHAFKHEPVKGGYLDIKMCCSALGRYVDLF